LWEMLVAKLHAPVEFQYYNPLKAKVGNAVTIDEMDLRDLNFFIKEVREYKRSISGQQFLFVDYVLLARPLGGEDKWVRLRLNPVDDPERVAGLTHQVLLLHLDDEMAYNEELHKVCNDTTKKFQVLQDGAVKEEFFRINDVTGSYKARVSVLKDLDSDGTVEESEVRKTNIEYWDYWREYKDEAGQPVTEFLFIEMDASNGWFQLWKGQEVDPQHVLVM